jgi:hypothetical protein
MECHYSTKCLPFISSTKRSGLKPFCIDIKNSYTSKQELFWADAESKLTRENSSS